MIEPVMEWNRANHDLETMNVVLLSVSFAQAAVTFLDTNHLKN